MIGDPEDRVRELLDGMAGEVDAPPPMPRRTMRRASRGTLATLLTALGTVAVVVIGASVGIRALTVHQPPRIPVSKGPTATPPPAAATSKVFTGVTFVDAEHGWMADSNGILATSDGGQTWTRQYAGHVDITSFDFLDLAHGWAVVAGGGLLRTSDGSTWEQVASPVQALDKGLLSVDFVSPSLGWGLAGRETGAPALVRSNDGGQTWTAISDGVDSMCLADETTGYVGGPGLVLKTTDGGSTWNTVLHSPGQWYSSELRCPAQDAVWALFQGGGAAGSMDYAAFRTADGGSTWRAELTSPLESNNPAFRGVAAIDNYPGPFAAVSADDAVFFGYCPACEASSTVMRTTDGTTWERSKIDGYLPQAVSFADPLHGWLIAQAGFQGADLLLATADGGATWSQVYPGESAAG